METSIEVLGTGGHPTALELRNGSKTSPMRKNVLIVVAACVILAAVAFFALRSRRHDSVEAAPEPPAASIATVKRGSIVETMELAGQFQAYQVVDIHPKVSGYIQHIYVDIGDKVHTGQTLAVLEVPELVQQLQETVAGLARSKDEITRAQHEVTRAESEYAAVHADNVRLQATAKAEPGLIAQQELDDALAKDLAAAAKIDADKAALAAAERGAEVASADRDRVGALNAYTNVISPLDGVVTWRYADTGALIQSGRDSNAASLPIVKVSQSGLLRLRLPVPEDAIKYIKMGDEMQVRVDALNRSFTGKVVRFAREVNFETRTMQTEVDVENKDLSIDPGMYAIVELTLAGAQNVLTVPVEALVVSGGNNRIVYVLDSQNRIHQRTVQIGIEGTKLAEVKSGLKEGERIVSGGNAKYEDGELVTPVFVNQPTWDSTRSINSTADANDQGVTQ